MPLKFVAIIILLLSSNSIQATEKTEVVVISALHGMHNNHPHYNYEDLYALVESYNPDYVGVEIRAEDIHKDQSYLLKNYPKEMVELQQRYQSRVFGFDWLGDSIQGRPIPENYWKDLVVLKLQRALTNDKTIMDRKPDAIETYQLRQQEMIEQGSIESIHNGEYGALCRLIDELEADWLRGTPYQEIIEFNVKRDQEIGNNIISFLRKHEGSRVVLVMGADHRTFAHEKIIMDMKDRVEILAVNNNVEK